jgi:hypothetical protein
LRQVCIMRVSHLTLLTWFVRRVKGWGK